MPKRAAPDPDASPDSAGEANPIAASGGDEEEEDTEENPEEEEEEEEEEVEEVEMESDEEEEEEGEEEEEEGADISDSAASVDEDDEDTSEKLESEGHGEDPKYISSTLERSSTDPISNAHERDNNGGNLATQYPSASLLSAQNKEASDITSRDAKSAVRDKHIISEENGFPKSNLDGIGSGLLLEKETSTEGLKDAKKYNAKAYGSLKSHLSSGDSVGVENFRSMRVQEDGLDAEKMVKRDSTIEKPGNVLEKDMLKPQTEINLQLPEDSSIASTHTPTRRPRSSSPDGLFENINKRPAIVCDFYARGWCIKGSSCRFLHQKDDHGPVSTSQWGKVASEPSKMGAVVDHTGLKEEAERSILSASHTRMDLSKAEGSSKADLFSQRALVRAYGGENHGLPQFHDYNLHGSEIATKEHFRVDISHNGPAPNLLPYEFKPASWSREGYPRPFRVNPYLESMEGRHLARGELLSRNLNEGKLCEEMPKGEPLNDAPFSRASHLIRNPLIPEYRHSLGGSSTTVDLLQNSYNTYAYGKAFQYPQSRFPIPDSYSSYGLASSASSSFDNALHPHQGSPSVHASGQRGASSARGSTPLNVEYLDTHKASDFDRGYYGSRSASLPGNVSPCYSRSEVEVISKTNVLGDPPACAGQQMQIQENAWEPSVPFQSSFLYASASKSSPGSEYDPLLDSIDLPKAGNLTFQTSPRTSIQNVSSQHINGDLVISGRHTPGHSAQKLPNSFPQSHENLLDRSTPAHGCSGYINPVAAPEHSQIEGGNCSLPKNENDALPRVMDGVNANVEDLGTTLKSEVDKDGNKKESKAVKIFRAALVDFVKELVKPSWREGHLSKDAHKMIVKKAVEKVISALQPHQVPTTTESINQYLSSSRPKVLKLVEGYVDKYSKP